MPKISVHPKPISKGISVHRKVSGVAASRLTQTTSLSLSKNRFRVKVVPRSSKNQVEKIAEGEYRVRLTSAPADGKANEQLVKLLAKHFGVGKSLIRIVSGATSRTKIIELP